MIENERRGNELISNHLSYLTTDMLSNERSGRKSATHSYKSQKIWLTLINYGVLKKIVYKAFEKGQCPRLSSNNHSLPNSTTKKR